MTRDGTGLSTHYFPLLVHSDHYGKNSASLVQCFIFRLNLFSTFHWSTTHCLFRFHPIDRVVRRGLETIATKCKCDQRVMWDNVDHKPRDKKRLTTVTRWDSDLWSHYSLRITYPSRMSSVSVPVRRTRSDDKRNETGIMWYGKRPTLSPPFTPTIPLPLRPAGEVQGGGYTSFHLSLRVHPGPPLRGHDDNDWRRIKATEFQFLIHFLMLYTLCSVAFKVLFVVLFLLMVDLYLYFHSSFDLLDRPLRRVNKW